MGKSPYNSLFHHLQNNIEKSKYNIKDFLTIIVSAVIKLKNSSRKLMNVKYFIRANLLKINSILLPLMQLNK